MIEEVKVESTFIGVVVEEVDSKNLADQQMNETIKPLPVEITETQISMDGIVTMIYN